MENREERERRQEEEEQRMREERSKRRRLNNPVWDIIRCEAKFIDLLLEDKVNSGIRLSYRPSSHVA